MSTPLPSRYSPPRLSLRWLPVWQRNYRVWRKLLVPALVGNIFEPLLYLVALGYGLGTFIGELQGMDYLTYIASGLVCASAMNTATFEGLYSAYTRMAMQRTWEGMLVAPLAIEDVVLGETLWAGTKSLISGAAILLVAVPLGAVHQWSALWVLPVLLLTGIAFGAMALVVTAVARSYDFFVYYFTLLVTPMFLFSGVFFPLEQLPAAMQWLAQALPLTHAVALARPLMTGLPLGDIPLHLAVLAAYCAAGFYVATVLVRRRLII